MLYSKSPILRGFKSTQSLTFYVKYVIIFLLKLKQKVIKVTNKKMKFDILLEEIADELLEFFCVNNINYKMLDVVNYGMEENGESFIRFRIDEEQIKPNVAIKSIKIRLGDFNLTYKTTLQFEQVEEDDENEFVIVIPAKDLSKF